MHGTGRRRWACCGRRERRGDQTRRGRRDRRVPCAPRQRGHGAARGIGDEERSMALTLVLGSDEQRRHLEARGQGARWEKGDDLALHARDAGGVVTAQLGVLVQGCRVGRVRARDATPRVRRTRRGRRHGLADGHAHRRVERCRGDRPPTRCPVWIDPHHVARLSGTYLRGKVRRVASKNSGERRLGATNAEQNRREDERAEGEEDPPRRHRSRWQRARGGD